MRVAVCVYGDVRASVGIAEQFKAVLYKVGVDVYVHKKFTDPYPPDLAPRCAWLEEPRPITRPDGVSEEQAWVLWSMTRLGKMVIQTEQKEGRYALVAFASPDYCLTGLPALLVDGKVHTLPDQPDKVAIGTSTFMQLYLNKLSQLQTYCGRPEQFPGLDFSERRFAEWCLCGMGDDRKRASNWVEDLR